MPSVRELPAERHADRLFRKRSPVRVAAVSITEGEANALRAALTTSRDPLARNFLAKLDAADFQTTSGA